MGKRSFAALTVAAVFAASCGGRPEATTSTPPAAVSNVRIAEVEKTSIEDFYEATGTVRSRATTIISSRVIGSVLSVRAREGDRVRAGAVVVEIDNREAASQLQKAQAGIREAQASLGEIEQSARAAEAARRSAEANLQLAASTLARYRTLLERKSVSPQEFDEVNARHAIAEAEAERASKMLDSLDARKRQILARIDQAKADLAAAEINSGYARITSPVNGIVIARTVEVGAMAQPGAPLLTIEDEGRYRLEASVEESQMSRIRMGARALVNIDATGSGEIEGRVGEIVPAADPASRSYTVKIDLPGVAGLRSGLYGTARFTSGAREILSAPAGAIIERGQLTGVMAVDAQGIARLRLVRTGKTFGDRIEILSGLDAGQRIIVEGAAAVSDGSRVR
ncbi:MAG: efflux RND transporter periplasmic adaptor subunit [Blastocatellales bacterium]|nr:efflux RND transporter periplasmic adaptor subunit [Blastocatellales bacterium]